MQSPEATIIAKHNLNVSNIDSLANDIASRLNINIEFGIFDFKSNKLIASGHIINDENNPTYYLFPQNNNHPEEVNYVLELGDEAKLIYKEIISLMLPFPLEYDDLIEEHTSNPEGLFTGGNLKTSLEGLQKLGAQKIYFIGDYNTAQSGINYNDEKNYTWNEFTDIIQNHVHHFIEPKQLTVNQ